MHLRTYPSPYYRGYRCFRAYAQFALSFSLAGPTLFPFLNGAPLRALHSQPSGFNEPQMRCFNDVVNIWPNIWRGRRSRGRADVRSAERAGQDWIRNMIFCQSENLAGRGLIRPCNEALAHTKRKVHQLPAQRVRILRAHRGFVRRLGLYIICAIIITPSIFERDQRQLPWVCAYIHAAQIWIRWNIEICSRAREKFYLFSNTKRANELLTIKILNTQKKYRM